MPSRPGRRLLVVGALTAVVAVGAAVVLASTPADRGGDGARASGGPAPAVVFEGFGRAAPVALSDLRGKPLVLNYWASWCLFCIEEMPDFQAVYRRVSDEVEFLGVNVRDDPAEAARFAESTGVRYPLAVDRDGRAYERLRGFAMPTTWFIDEDGRILERFSGPLTADELASRIGEHFGA